MFVAGRGAHSGQLPFGQSGARRLCRAPAALVQLMIIWPKEPAAWPRWRRWVFALGVALLPLATTRAADVSVHSSNRYYQDATGKPMFLVGYYAWSSAVDGYFIDHSSRYSDMMNQGAPYKINYIRIGAQSPRMSGSSNPPTWNGATLPSPYAVDGSNRANL